MDFIRSSSYVVIWYRGTVRCYRSLRFILLFLKYLVLFYRKSRFTVSEVISALEDDPDFFRADIYITPPENGMVSDADSADEEISTHVSPDNLCGKQLRAEGEATIYRPTCEKERFFGSRDTPQPSDDEEPADMVPVSFYKSYFDIIIKI
jgi:hypothetical protein